MEKAAIAAGYSPNGGEVAASRLLSQVKVQEALAEARLQLVAVSGVTTEALLAGGMSRGAVLAGWRRAHPVIRPVIGRKAEEGSCSGHGISTAHALSCQGG
ncbi:terminase small subunit [Pseudoroseomonas wenyumeiae]